MFEDVLHSGDSIMGATGGHRGSHEILWSALYELMRTIASHREEIYVFHFLIG